MAISSEMMPELIDPSGFDSILASPYQDYHAQQLGAWGLPIRPAMGADRRRRQQYADDILAQNELANNLRNILSNRQLDVDMRGQDVDLSKSVVSSLDTGNDAAMGALGPVQEILANPEAFDAILGSGDEVNRYDIATKGNKQQAEAESEPIKAKAAMISAQNAGADKGPKIKRNFNPMGDEIGYSIEGPYAGDPNESPGKPSPSMSIYDEGNNQPMELPSSAVTGRRLIRNSDGSGTIITEDGQRLYVSPGNMKKEGY